MLLIFILCYQEVAEEVEDEVSDEESEEESEDESEVSIFWPTATWAVLVFLLKWLDNATFSKYSLMLLTESERTPGCHSDRKSQLAKAKELEST